MYIYIYVYIYMIYIILGTKSVTGYFFIGKEEKHAGEM